MACKLLKEVDVITTDYKYLGRETEYRTANANLPEAEKVQLPSSICQQILS